MACVAPSMLLQQATRGLDTLPQALEPELRAASTSRAGSSPTSANILVRLFPVKGNEKHLTSPNCVVLLQEIYGIWKPLKYSLSLFKERT